MLEVWTLYEKPSDYPGLYVARRFEIHPNNPEPQPTADVIVNESLEVLRDHFERMGFTLLPRWPDDDPVIAGVYMK
jgi:hypothetical protein